MNRVAARYRLPSLVAGVPASEYDPADMRTSWEDIPWAG